MVSRLRSGDPTQVGRYEVLSRIGGGGMGMVYLAEGPRGRVALKLVRPELGDDPHFRARFRREVQASFRVSGVCTVRLLDFDTEADQPWMATEYVDGPSLTELIEAGGPLSPPKQLALAVGLAEGLKSIHDEDVVHRDLKPSNVLCAPDGPKVIDFGIAAAADAAPITRSGLMVGSPGWLSPEQITTGRASAASDVFALGCILVYAAGGEQPFGTGTAEALFYRVLNQGPNINYDLLAPPLHDLVRAATAQDPSQRPSARALLDALLEAGAVAGDVRGDAGSSVTSVLQRDWSLPSGLIVQSDGPGTGTHTGAAAGAAPAAAGAAAVGAAAGSAGGSPMDFSKGSASAPPAAPPSAPPPSTPPPSAPPSSAPPSFAPPGPWTPPPAGQTPAPVQSQRAAVPAYTPPPAPVGYQNTPPPGTLGGPTGPGPYGGTPSGPPTGGFGPPSYPPAAQQPGGPSGGRKPWLIPALVGGGVLALVVVLVVVLVAGGGGGGGPQPSASPVVAKDPNRTRSPAEVDGLVRAAALQTADLPGYKLDKQEEPPGLLMPCDIDIQDFPSGAKADGLDFQDDNSNYLDQRIAVTSTVGDAQAFFGKLQSALSGCRDYKDSSGDAVKISDKDPNFAVGDDGFYVNEVKGTVYLSWGYMRRGTAVVLVSTINDTDQKTTIQQLLGRTADRLAAAD